MTESNPWADQWLKAQQQFVGAWSDMAKSGASNGQSSQADMWAQSFDLWRKASGAQAQPEIQQAMNKCFGMGKEYLAMAEQISKSLSQGANPLEAINQWMEQLKQSLQQFGGMPGFDGRGVNDFMQQWFSPGQSWQDMTATLMPMNQAAWQMPGMNTSVFNMGEAIDPLGKVLSSPGIGYFREPQEKQQKGIQLAVEYQQANNAFNQAFLQVAGESIQGFQTRLMALGAKKAPGSLRALYDLWVEVSEEHYAEFAMSEEYQSLYGDMVNRLMALKKHYSEITDDILRAMNLPNTREVDTMQQRLQQLRRENIQLKKEVSEIKTAMEKVAVEKVAAEKAAAKKAASEKAAAEKVAAEKAAAVKAAAEKVAAEKVAAEKVAAKKAAAEKVAAEKAAAKKAAAEKVAAEKAAARESCSRESCSGESCRGKSCSGESRCGENRNRESCRGKSCSGESCSGESCSGESCRGKSCSGESRCGESCRGKSCSGESCSGESCRGKSCSGESRCGENRNRESRRGESCSRKSCCGEIRSETGRSEESCNEKGRSEKGSSEEGRSEKNRQ